YTVDLFNLILYVLFDVVEGGPQQFTPMTNTKYFSLINCEDIFWFVFSEGMN
ncbi:unnamed protein product, partial [marine sediment metagenome]